MYCVRKSRANASSTSTTSGAGKENESANKPPNKVNAKKMMNKYTSDRCLCVYSTTAVQMPRLYWHKTEGRKDIRWRDTLLRGRCKVLNTQASTSNSGHLRVNVSGSKAPI